MEPSGGGLSWDDVFKNAAQQAVTALGSGIAKILGGKGGASSPTVKVDIGSTTKTLIVGAAIIAGIVLMLRKG